MEKKRLINSIKSAASSKKLRIAVIIVLALALLGTSIAKYISETNDDYRTSLKKYSVRIDTPSGDEFDWEVHIPATTRLFDDDEFASVAVVRKMRITNIGDDALELSADFTDGITTDFHGNNHVTGNATDFCVFLSTSDPSRNLTETIRAAATGCDDESSAADIQNALVSNNNSMLSALEGTLGVNIPKYFYIVIWRENSSDNSTTDFDNLYSIYKHLKLGVAED